MKQEPSISLRLMFICLVLVAATAAQAQNGRHNRYRYENHHGYNGYYPAVAYSGYAPRYNYYHYRPYRVYNTTYRYAYPFVHYGPSIGLRIRILPFGYSSLYFGGVPYFYNEGIFYRPYPNGGYEVASPPLGATVSHLPADAKVTVINGEKYYELGGTFYREEISANNKLTYKVVGTDGVINTDDQEGAMGPVNNPPARLTPGTKLDELPAGTKVVVINQQKYYLSQDGVYFREVVEGNKVKYEVAGVE